MIVTFKQNINWDVSESSRVSHLHLHHLVFALGAERPLVGQGVVVVGALVAVQSDGVAWQLDDLNDVKKKAFY